MKKYILLIFIFFITGCTSKKNSFNDLLFSLVFINEPSALFSYPGRYSPLEKKREVLENIIKIIKSTESELIIYAYSLNHPEVLEELKNAYKKGVKIQIVLDKDKKYPFLDDNNIPYYKWEKSGLHHIKIILSDKKILFFGTGNFSDPGLTNDWNGYIKIPINQEFSNLFYAHMKGENNSVNLSYGLNKFLFSPENGVLIQDTIFSELEKATESIQILTFDHYDEILSHILRKKSSRGVRIEVIYNDPVDPEGFYLNKYLFGYSSFIFKDGNTDTIPGKNNFLEGGLLHHKTIIIDNKKLLTGSYNFSLNARNNNREVLVLTHHPILINEFVKEFERIKNASYTVDYRERSIESPTYNVVPKFNIDRVCTEDKIGSSTVELGNGIFKTYLRYSRITPNPCFIFKSPDEISSGLFAFSDEKVLSSQFLWDSIQIYPRFEPQVYKSSIDFPTFPSAENIQMLDLTDVRQTGIGKIQLSFKEPLRFSPGSVSIYQPGGNVIDRPFQIQNNMIYIENIENFSFDTFGGFFIFKTGESFYSDCFCKSRGKCGTVDYLKKKILFYNGRSSSDCLRI